MQTIPGEFIDDYLLALRDLTEEQTRQRGLAILKKFEQTLPLTFKDFISAMPLLRKLSPGMADLEFNLGALMFELYRRFYGGFANPEREGLGDEKCREAVQIMLTREPESGVSRAKQTELLHGFFQQSVLMGFVTLQLRNFTDEYPKEKPYLTAVLMHLAVLAAQLNTLVGLPEKDLGFESFCRK